MPPITAPAAIPVAPQIPVGAHRAAIEDLQFEDFPGEEIPVHGEAEEYGPPVPHDVEPSSYTPKLIEPEVPLHGAPEILPEIEAALGNAARGFLTAAQGVRIVPLI